MMRQVTSAKFSFAGGSLSSLLIVTTRKGVEVSVLIFFTLIDRNTKEAPCTPQRLF